MGDHAKGLLAIIITFFGMLYLFMRDMSEMSRQLPLVNKSNQFEERVIGVRVPSAVRPKAPRKPPQEVTEEIRPFNQPQDAKDGPSECERPDDIVHCLVDVRDSSYCLIQSDSMNLSILYSKEELYPDKNKYESLKTISDNFDRTERISREEELDEYIFLKQKSAAICVSFREMCLPDEKQKTVRMGEDEFIKLLSIFTPSELKEYITSRLQVDSKYGCERAYWGDPDSGQFMNSIEETLRTYNEEVNKAQEDL